MSKIMTLGVALGFYIIVLVSVLSDEWTASVVALFAGFYFTEKL